MQRRGTGFVARSCAAGASVFVVAALAWGPPAAAWTPVELCELPSGLGSANYYGDPLDESIPSGWDDFIRPHGELTIRVLLVQFRDYPHQTAADAEFQEVASAAAWYETSSYGQVDLRFVGGDKWYTMPDDGVSYGQLDYKIVRHAIEAADPEVDFTGTDILAIVPQAGSHSGSWATPGSGPTLDGHRIRAVEVMSGGGMLNTVHETGHTFGLPDLYPYEPYRRPDGRNPAGMWDVMSSGLRRDRGDFFAWHKWRLEWLGDDQIVCAAEPGSTQAVLQPLGSPPAAGETKAVVVRTGGHSAYVVENRQAVGVDTGICEEGALVYEVNTHLGSGQGPIAVQTNVPDDDRLVECGQWWNAPLSEGEVFADPLEGVTIEVVGAEGDALEVRVTRSNEGARTAVSLRVGRRYVARGTVSSPDMPGCVGGARVRIARIDSPVPGQFVWVTEGRTRAPDDGSYRVSLPRPGGAASYIAIVRPRTVRGTECFDSISAFTGGP